MAAAIAEAIAAGKLVITDHATAEPFGAGVVSATTTEVDRVIADHIAEPARYAEAVLRAQSDLAAYRPEAVTGRLISLIGSPEVAHAVL